MNSTKINPKDILFSLDIGTRSVIGTVGVIRDKKFCVICEKYIEHEERAMIDGQIHDIHLVANEVSRIKKELEKELGITLNSVSIAAAGRLLRTISVKTEIELDSDKEIDKEVIRSLELTAVKKAETELNKSTDGKLYCVGYSVKNYYLNGYVITNLLSHKGENIGADIIATFLPRTVVDSLYSVMSKVNLSVDSMTLEPIAAIEAVIPKNLRLLNLALVDIGAGTSDIAISSKDTISAYGMVPLAGDEVTEVISQNYLVDFNTAENIKKDLETNEVVKYVDVLGLENEVKSEEVLKIIKPVVDKISKEISTKIIDLNGGKAPNAIFLVGGGAHTPHMQQTLAEKLNLDTKRIAIKGRDSITNCICLNNDLGSIGVTVLGIALVSIQKSGNDFINVTLNESVISLFNSYKHTIMDVVMQAGINPKLLICRNGKNIRFLFNDINRVAFGEMGRNAEIKINGETATLDTEVGEGDNIEIEFAQNGKSAEPKIKDCIKNLNTVSFYLNNELKNIEPICFSNGEKKDLNYIIKDKDIIKVIYPKTIKDYKNYYEVDNDDYFIDDVLLDTEYTIQEGDKIFTKSYIEKTKIMNQEMQIVNEIKVVEETNNIYEEESNAEKIKEEKNNSIRKEIALDMDKEGINVKINSENYTLKGKSEYIFIDIFDYIDFDLTTVKGKLELILNGKNAAFHDKLQDGDIIRVFWS